jgi:hypothetical protein
VNWVGAMLRIREYAGALRILSSVLAVAITLAAIAQTKHALTNDDILKMAKDGFSDDVIVAMVEASDTAFDVSLSGLSSLKNAGISSPVMQAMLKAESKKRQATASSSPPPQAQSSAVLNPSQSMPGMTGLPSSASMQQAMAMAMSMGRGGAGMMGGGMGAMLDASQLPPLNLLLGDVRSVVKASIAQIASTQTKGDDMPGAGAQATSMLAGLGRQALSFGAIGGSMFAGPAAGMAMGMVGSLGAMSHHHGPPKITYVWALPGAQSSFAIAGNNPKFEMSYGNLLGIDPDAYEPQLIRLVESKDNWRLVGATKTTMGQMGNEAYEKVTEARIAVTSQRIARGQMQIAPKQPLQPGEYAVVLRAIHPGKRAEGSLGGGAETSLFFSVWDFSVGESPAPKSQ